MAGRARDTPHRTRSRHTAPRRVVMVVPSDHLGDGDDGFTFPPPRETPENARRDVDDTPSPSRPFHPPLDAHHRHRFNGNVSPILGGHGARVAASARDVTVITLGVAVIASACACWLLQVLAYLLRPLVTATGAALLLRPLVDFVSDAQYQRDVVRRHAREGGGYCCRGNRAVTVPRVVAIVFALSVVCAVFGTLIWALYLGRVYLWVHWNDTEWNERFMQRITNIGQGLSDFARRVFKKDDVAEEAWARILNNIESRLRDEEFWETLGVGVFHYVQDVMLMLFYTLFLLVPQREVSRARSLMVRRIRKATRRFVSIMVQIAVVRALLVGALLGLCGVPWPLSIAVAIVSFWLFFIPTLGSIVASLLPIPMLVLLPDMSEQQRWAGAVVPNLVSFLVGDLIGPVVYRKGLDLNEVTVLLALVFWYSVWGAAGAVLGVPLTCAMKIALEEMPHEGAHALAAVMAPAQSARTRDSGNAREGVRVPMTLTFISWIKQMCVRLFDPRLRRGARRRDEEALLDETSEELEYSDE